MIGLLAAAPAVSPLPPDRFAGLTYVGRAVLPRALEVQGTRVGGLSSLTWDDAAQRFWAISDDRGERGPVRWYEIRLDITTENAAPRLGPEAFVVESVVVLKDRRGRPFEPRRIDTEGLARHAGGFFVSTEAIRALHVPAAIFDVGPDGRVRGELPLPAGYRPGPARGVRDNLGFEGLALTPDGQTLFAGLENAREQDGPAAAPGVASPARLIRYDLAAPPASTEFEYLVDPVGVPVHGTPGTRLNGLSDILALGRDRVLALERQYVAGVGNAARLYDVSLDAAARSASKTLLLDLAEVGVPLENFEGMSLGPVLPDGRRSFVIVSDDNFNPEQDPTTFLVFALEAGPVTIPRVQGAALRSPLEGRWAFGVEGIVSAVDADPRSAGFWIESARADADAATSEGLFVSWADASALVPGAGVRVNGRVEEVAQPRGLPVTRLRAASVSRLADVPPLPPPVRLFTDVRMPGQVDDDGLAQFEPSADALDLWESLEGMRVELPGGVVVGPTSRFGDIGLRPDGAPEVLRTPAGGVKLTEAGPSLDRASLGRRIAGATPQVSVGTRLLGPIVGVVDYTGAAFRVQALKPPDVESAGGACDERTALTGDASRLTVATFNVENLSVAGPAERFVGLGDVIARRLLAPDVVALQEVQDDSGPAKGDGVVTSKRTLETLVQGIVAAGGPAYEAVWIDPVEGKEGGQPGGNIRVALLVNPRRLELVRRGAAGPLDATEPEGSGRDVRLALSPGRVAPGSPAFTLAEGEGVRRSLAAEARFRGQTLFVVVNHLSSKSDDDRPTGAVQPPRRPTDPRRLAQAREVRAFAERLLSADRAARVVVLGDLNDFEFAEAVQALGAPPLENLLLRVPEADRYTFNFEGASQALDHVIVSPALAAEAEADVVHVNADCADASRTSDHDPVVVRLRPR